MMARKAAPKRYAVGYARVSTEQQVESRLSLEAQETQIRAHCAAQGLELLELIQDPGVSGGLPLQDREGGARLARLVEGRLVSVVVASRLDRLFRSSSDCLSNVEAWDRREVALHLLDLGGQALDTSSTMGRFFLTVMAAAAEMERSLVRDRTRAAIAAKVARGEYPGGKVPFGYRAIDGRLVEDQAEQRVLGVVRGLRDEGHSLAMIAAELTRRGFVGRTGRAFARQQIHQLLRHSATQS